LVDAKNKLLKKKKDEALKLKTDSYTVETDVHFPTHLNLLWDGCRKCLDMVKIPGTGKEAGSQSRRSDKKSTGSDG
jgi:hypothetical protein